MHKRKLTYREYQRYFNGEMQPDEAHSFEKEMMKDEFDRDAFDGLSQLDENELSADVDALKARLKERTKTTRKTIPLWFKYAAGLALLIGLGGSAFYIFNEKLSHDVAYQEPIMENMAASDSVPDKKKVLPDENAPIIQQKSYEEKLSEKEDTEKTRKKARKKIPETMVESDISTLDKIEQDIDAEPVGKTQDEVALEEETPVAKEKGYLENTQKQKKVIAEIIAEEEEAEQDEQFFAVESANKAMPTRKKTTAQAMRKKTTTEAMPPNQWSYENYKKQLLALILKNDLADYSKNYRLEITLQIGNEGEIRKIKIKGAPNNSFKNLVEKAINEIGNWQPALHKGKAQKTVMKINLDVNLR